MLLKTENVTLEENLIQLYMLSARPETSVVMSGITATFIGCLSSDTEQRKIGIVRLAHLPRNRESISPPPLPPPPPPPYSRKRSPRVRQTRGSFPVESYTQKVGSLVATLTDTAWLALAQSGRPEFDSRLCSRDFPSPVIPVT